ncbi:MAG: GNAT family N-acetyltransferase [Haliscomenobacteraceae bacterium CHB4]|nr:GNAT family N-acetyltransferase [Haliscomenobacteraceae bacterium CHB4]
MKGSVTYAYPDQKFWDAYSRLWQNSLYKPVFQTPRFIQYLARKFEHELAVYQCYRGDELVGAAFFRKDGKIYKLLSEIKADHNVFVIHQDCTEEETRFFFQYFFEEVKKQNWTLVLSYQPAWALYLDTLEQAGKSKGLYLNVSKHSVCPMLQTDTPEEMMEQFKKSKELKYSMNRLIKQQGAIFEVFTDDEDIDNWSDQFCRCHVKRWQATSTPSRYDTSEMQELNRECMRAWAKDNHLIRFSVRIGDERVAFNAVLLQGDVVIGHAQAFDPEYQKYSPGKALMYAIGEWMLSRRLTKLDFGKGGEAYKANMTNLEPELHKIFISSYTNLPFVLKTQLETTIRSNTGLIKMYRQKIKPKIQGAKTKIETKAQRLMGNFREPRPHRLSALMLAAQLDSAADIFLIVTNLV